MIHAFLKSQIEKNTEAVSKKMQRANINYIYIYA